jgi:hypothetical protein
MKKDGILQFCRLSFKKEEKNDKKEEELKRRNRRRKANETFSNKKDCTHIVFCFLKKKGKNFFLFSFLPQSSIPREFYYLS